MQGRCLQRARSSGRSVVACARRAQIILVTAVLVLLPQIASAQGSPWERAAGLAPDNLARPSDLSTMERHQLKDALAITRQLRVLLRQRFRFDAL